MKQLVVPTKWKLKEFLEAKGITAYQVAQKSAGKLSQNSVYNLTKQPTSIRMETLDVLIPILRELTGDKSITIVDILEYDQ